MRTIEDLQHFVLAEGETLILRPSKLLSQEQLTRMREGIERMLPGRPVLVLSPEIEVMAGPLEIMGMDLGVDEGPTQEDIDAARKLITDDYDRNCNVYVYDREDREWFVVHQQHNPHTFEWDKYDYRLTKP
jgi:hypothetical protein